MISTTLFKEHERSFPIPEQISKPVVRSFSRKIFSLHQKYWYKNTIYQPLDVESLYKKGATTWKWFSWLYFNHSDLRLRRLSSLIKSSKKTQELNILVKQCGKIPNYQLSYISQSLKTCLALKKVEFTLEECPQITDAGLLSLCRGLQTRCELSNLSLCLTKSRITDKGIQGLSTCLKRLRALRKLELNFRECRDISDDGLKVLSNGLKNVKELRNLGLSFGYCYCTEITDESLKIISKQLERWRFSLKSLSLDFSTIQNITDEGLRLLRESLKKLTLLEKIDLKFVCCTGASSLGLQYISEGLLDLILLKEISLDFSYLGRFRNRHLHALGKNLRGLRALEILRIDLSNSSVTDGGLCFLKEIRQNIKELEMNFSFCSFISNSGVQNLMSRGLKELVSLRKLSIQFQQYSRPSMINIRLESLSEGLKRLVLLRELNLNFASCSKITDKGFISLCEALKKLVLLENLTLNFSKCSQITTQGGLKLCRIVKNLGSCLKELNWNFGNCDLFGEVEIYVLCKYLKNCKQFEKMTLLLGKDTIPMNYDSQEISWVLDKTIKDLEAKGVVYCDEEEEKSVKDNVEKRKEKEVLEEEKRQKGEKTKKNTRGFSVFQVLFGCFAKKPNEKKKSAVMPSN